MCKLAAFLLGAYAAVAAAQTVDPTPTTTRTFEVASIKRNLSGSRVRTTLDGPQPGGRWTLVSITFSATTGDVRTVTSGGTRVSTLLAPIAAAVGRPIIDKTGLEGYYEYTVEYSSSMPLSLNTSLEPAAPSIFTALREQLGLTLVSEDNDLPVLVIDRLQQPTED